ncbi:MAG: hypothetical protein J5871_03750 [Bacteroidales bacterium]|nr:hypothetical protein [Bacteroidales bacterium]
MKRIILLALLAFLPVLPGRAQEDAQGWKAAYQRQVKYVGEAGTGVSLILDKWEKAFPEDPAVFHARHRYWLEKARSVSLQPRAAARYMGAAPALTLQDSTGAPVHYFEVVSFSDSLFGRASDAIRHAIALAPAALDYRAAYVSSLCAYEQESPDMAAAELRALLDLHASRHPAWTWEGGKVGEADFCSLMQEFCYGFFKTGTPASYEAFRQVSERLAALWPRSAEYQNNLGSYWFVAKRQAKRALKYYEKALKLDAGNLSAAQNCVLLARKEGDVRLEKKYLPLLISLTEDAQTRAALEARARYLADRK